MWTVSAALGFLVFCALSLHGSRPMKTLSGVQINGILTVSELQAVVRVYSVLTSTQWLFIEEVVYYTVHWVIKSAFLSFYLRLSPNHTFRRFVYIGVVLNACIWVVNM
jgi:hypothetical protein